MMTPAARLLRAFLAHDVLRFAVLVAAAAFLLDWATKSWALQTLEHAPVPLGALMLGIERNNALAFSTGSGQVPAWLVVALRLIALAGVIALSVHVGARNRRFAAGFALLIAGGSGNAADMLFRGGAVVDFIHAGPFHVRGELVHAGIVTDATDEYSGYLAVAWIGFLVNFLSGAALFSSQATSYVTNVPFLLKMAFVLAGAVTVGYLQAGVARVGDTLAADDVATGAIKIGAIVSILVWLGATVTGRLIAYL